jgi:hypothetical protein
MAGKWPVHHEKRRSLPIAGAPREVSAGFVEFSTANGARTEPAFALDV